MCRPAAIYFKYVRNERASVCFLKSKILKKYIYIYLLLLIYLMNHIYSLLCKYTIAICAICYKCILVKTYNVY